MEALKLDTIIEKDGEIRLTGIPCKKGQKIEMILLLESSRIVRKESLEKLPKYHLGNVLSGMSREDIYEDAR